MRVYVSRYGVLRSLDNKCAATRQVVKGGEYFPSSKRRGSPLCQLTLTMLWHCYVRCAPASALYIAADGAQEYRSSCRIVDLSVPLPQYFVLKGKGFHTPT